MRFNGVSPAPTIVSEVSWTVIKTMENEKQTNPLAWSIKVVLSVAAVLLGYFSHAMGGWGLPTAVAGAAIVLPILKYKQYWDGLWFWMTILAMSAIQVPLVILFRPVMDQLKFGFNILFATVDVFLVAVAVNWVRPKE
jgi:hypothetical protein